MECDKLPHEAQGCYDPMIYWINYIRCNFHNIDVLRTNFLEECRVDMWEERDDIVFCNSKEIVVLSVSFTFFRLLCVFKQMKLTRALFQKWYKSNSNKY